MENYFFKDHREYDYASEVFEDKGLDVNRFYENGFINTKLTPSMNAKLLALFERLNFGEYKMDSIDHGYGQEYSFNRNGFPIEISKMVDKIYSEFAPVLSMFDIPEIPLNLELSVCKLGKDYYVDWHQDCHNQAVLSFCLILNKENIEPTEGGVLQFSKVMYDEQGGIIDRNIVGEFPTNNSGQIIFFNPSDLNYQHRCTKIEVDKTRYLVAGIIGEVD